MLGQMAHHHLLLDVYQVKVKLRHLHQVGRLPPPQVITTLLL